MKQMNTYTVAVPGHTWNVAAHSEDEARAFISRTKLKGSGVKRSSIEIALTGTIQVSPARTQLI